MNAYDRNYRKEKALDKDIRSLIVDTILSEGGSMLQQDINRVIFEFTATQFFHCRYININTAKFKNSK